MLTFCLRPLQPQSAPLPNLLFPIIRSSDSVYLELLTAPVNKPHTDKLVRRRAVGHGVVMGPRVSAVLKRAWQCEGRNVVASTKQQLVPLHKHSIHIQIITCPWNSGAGKLCLMSHKRPTTDLAYGFERSRRLFRTLSASCPSVRLPFPLQVEVL